MEAKPEFVTVELSRDIISRKDLLNKILEPTWAFVLELHGDDFEVTIRTVPKVDEASPA